MPQPDIQFALIAEQGILEEQALLLCESIRRFSGRYRNSQISIISPRAGRRPSVETISRVRDMNVEYVEFDINSLVPTHGPSYKVHAAALIERQSNAASIAFLDSDIVIISEPDLDLYDYDSAIRPVDVKGMCTSGDTDEYDPYWRNLTRICDVDYDDIPFITTTVDQSVVKASYNGGFVITRRSAGIFQATEDFFGRAVRSNLRPYAGRNHTIQTGHGIVSDIGAEYWGSSQACLSLAIWGRHRSARLLTPAHNFPMHVEDYVQRYGSEAELIAVHYHHRFENDQTENPLLTGRLNISNECRAWLESRLPIGAARKPHVSKTGFKFSDILPGFLHRRS